MQFYYKEKIHEKLYIENKIGLLTKLRAKFKLVGRQVVVVLTSDTVVVIPDGVTIMQEVGRAFIDAKAQGLVTNTISARTFIYFLKMSPLLRKIIFSALSVLFGPIKIYQIAKIIFLRRCNFF